MIDELIFNIGLFGYNHPFLSILILIFTVGPFILYQPREASFI